MDKEEWKTIPGFNTYEISDQGRIRSYHAHGGTPDNPGMRWHISDEPQRILHPCNDPDGYKFVRLVDDNANNQTRRVASLVLLAFVGPMPPETEVCHRNDIKDDNGLSNLHYDTHENNLLAAYRNGRLGNLSYEQVQRLSDKEIYRIRTRYASGERTAIIATDFHRSPRTIRAICTGKKYEQSPGPLTKRKNNSPQNRRGCG